MSGIYCTKCGAVNQSGSLFCSHCGASLSAPAPMSSPVSSQPTTTYPYTTTPSSLVTPPANATSSPPGVPPYPAHDYYAEMKQRDLQTQIDRTKTGLLLLIIGLIIAALPVVSLIGGILSLVGAIMVILGRKGFGQQHARNTIISLILYCVGFVVVFIGVLVLGFSLVGASFGGSVDQGAVATAVEVFLATILASAIIIGIGTVLFTYALQKQTGRILLLVGYALSVVISAVTLVYLGSILSSTLASAFSSGTYNPTPVQDLRGQASAFGILGIIPGIIYAIAFYMARERIVRGEIPMHMQPITPPSPQPIGY